MLLGMLNVYLIKLFPLGGVTFEMYYLDLI